MTIQEEQTIIEVALPDLLREVERLHADGYRLVQIGCTGIGGADGINNSFVKGRLLYTYGSADEKGRGGLRWRPLPIKEK